MARRRWISKRDSALAVIAALYLVYFQFEGLAYFCLSRLYGYPEAALAIPPFAIGRYAGLLTFCAALLGCWMYVFLLFSLLAVRRRVLVIMLPLTFLVTAIASYFVTTTGVPISLHLMEAAFETNTNEFSEAVSLRLLGSITAALLLCAILLRVFWSDLHGLAHAPSLPGGARWRGLGRTLGATGIAGYALLAPTENPLAFYPHNLLRATGEYVQYKVDMDRRLARRRDISADGVDWVRPPADDLIVVVVLGESARADHFSLNGYPRATNPRLASVRNLVSFPHVTACATLTRTAVPCLMTRATASTQRVSLDETSVLSVFNRLGFTTAWLSVNGVYAEYDNNVSAIAMEAQMREFLGSIPTIGSIQYDSQLLPRLDRILAETPGRRFVVLHTLGSHWSYDRRYPPAYRRFEPTCSNGAIHTCERQALINSYDNSILYTDSVVKRVISRLRGRNALLLYVADHGQLLGEGRRFMHGQNHPEVLQVPMLWWPSDRFLQENRAGFERLRARRSERVSHDHVFHSLLDCIGVRSPIIDRGLSVCAEPTADGVVTATSPPAD